MVTLFGICMATEVYARARAFVRVLRDHFEVHHNTSRKPQAGDRVLGCIMLGSGLGRMAAVLALLASAGSGGGRRWDSICAPRRDQTSCIPGTKM